eukprot:TRINITY_DN263_c0_g1_i5.p1 TRINITY_DN263_c0_g1~~TRINITY_DN263_c0_g1_i5.p1  ORF type:complete len:811 (-),score=98.19 TRINITY_DN263_c0_g1_i5:68-2374(-)
MEEVYEEGTACAYDCGVSGETPLIYTCTIEGIWIPSGSCDCFSAELPKITGATHSCSNNTYPEDGKCEYLCEVPSEEPLIYTCNQIGHWIRNGSCGVLNCSDTDLPNLPYANHSCTNETYTEDETCLYTCETEGDIPLTYTCLSTGNWEKAGDCAKPCNKSSLTNVTYGYPTCTEEAYAINEECSYTCEVEGTGHVFATCLQSGEWKLTGICGEPIPCSNATLPNELNATHNCKNETYAVGEECAYTCELDGESDLIFVCLPTGIWNKTGTCGEPPVTCPSSTLPTESNANHSCTNATYSVGDFCEYTCEFPGEDDLIFICLDNGLWNQTGGCGLPPVVTCPSSTLPLDSNANHSCTNETYVEGEQCAYVCEWPGEDPLMYTCGSDGNWTVTGACGVPCVASSLPIISNASNDCTGNYSLQTVCSYECDDPNAVGSPTATCSVNGTWIPNDYCRIPVIFGCNYTDLNATALGATAGSCRDVTVDGDECSPACADGSSGAIIATCSNGTWVTNGSCIAPVIRDCNYTDLNVVELGVTAGTCRAVTVNGDVCSPACAAGSFGAVSASCNNGTWETEGSCTRGSPDCVFTNLNVAELTATAGTCRAVTVNGSECSPACAIGLSGTIIATCNNGAWTTSGTCTPNQPGQPFTIAGTSLRTCEFIRTNTIAELNSYLREYFAEDASLVLTVTECGPVANDDARKRAALNRFVIGGTLYGDTKAFEPNDLVDVVSDFITKDPAFTIEETQVSSSLMTRVTLLAFLVSSLILLTL